LISIKLTKDVVCNYLCELSSAPRKTQLGQIVTYLRW